MMAKSPILKIYDDVDGFKATILNESDEEKKVFEDSLSFTSNLANTSSILGLGNLVELIEYGDELFHEFAIDTDRTEKPDYAGLNIQLEKALPILSEEITAQNLGDTLTNELNENLVADLSASVFDALVAQLLVFVINLARDLHIDDVTFSSELMEIPRFKKLISDELTNYGMNLV